MKAQLLNTSAFLGTNLAMPVGTSAADLASQLVQHWGILHGIWSDIKFWSQTKEGTCLCRGAFSLPTCTGRSTDTTNYSRQSSGVVPLLCSSVETCFLAQHCRQFISDIMKILFTSILSQLSQERATP